MIHHLQERKKKMVNGNVYMVNESSSLIQHRILSYAPSFPTPNWTPKFSNSSKKLNSIYSETYILNINHVSNKTEKGYNTMQKIRKFLFSGNFLL